MANDLIALVRAEFGDGDFFEVQEHFAQNIIIGFARLNGRPVGIVAQQPRALAGVLDIDASDKAARFVRFWARPLPSNSPPRRITSNSMPSCNCGGCSRGSLTRWRRRMIHFSIENIVHCDQILLF